MSLTTMSNQVRLGSSHGADQVTNGELDTQVNGQSHSKTDISQPTRHLNFHDVRHIDNGIGKASRYTGAPAIVNIYHHNGTTMGRGR